MAEKDSGNQEIGETSQNLQKKWAESKILSSLSPIFRASPPVSLYFTQT